jgi:hypothetical protein
MPEIFDGIGEDRLSNNAINAGQAPWRPPSGTVEDRNI